MFTLGARDPFGCRGVSCVKLPATVAFPTDDRLMQRIEASRRALPPNNMKPLLKRREPLNVVATNVQCVREVKVQPAPSADFARDKLSPPGESRPPTLHLVRIEELYLRNKMALCER